jgi:hypothetical protein
MTFERVFLKFAMVLFHVFIFACFQLGSSIILYDRTNYVTSAAGIIVPIDVLKNLNVFLNPNHVLNRVPKVLSIVIISGSLKIQ